MKQTILVRKPYLFIPPCPKSFCCPQPVLLRVSGLPKPSVVTHIPSFTVYIPKKAGRCKSQVLFRRALKIVKSRLEKDHPTTIVVRQNYQGLLDGLGRELEKKRVIKQVPAYFVV